MELHNQGYLEVKLADFGFTNVVYASRTISGTLTHNAVTSVSDDSKIFERLRACPHQGVLGRERFR